MHTHLVHVAVQGSAIAVKGLQASLSTVSINELV